MLTQLTFQDYSSGPLLKLFASQAEILLLGTAERKSNPYWEFILDAILAVIFCWNVDPGRLIFMKGRKGGGGGARGGGHRN